MHPNDVLAGRPQVAFAAADGPAPGVSVDAAMDEARSAGLEDEAVLSGAAAAAASGDVERAVALLRPLTDANARWLDAFERYERLGLLPPGLVARLV